MYKALKLHTRLPMELIVHIGSFTGPDEETMRNRMRRCTKQIGPIFENPRSTVLDIVRRYGYLQTYMDYAGGIDHLVCACCREAVVLIRNPDSLELPMPYGTTEEIRDTLISAGVEELLLEMIMAEMRAEFARAALEHMREFLPVHILALIDST